MPVLLEKQIAKSAAKHKFDKKTHDAYVYGTMNKIQEAWKKKYPNEPLTEENWKKHHANKMHPALVHHMANKGRKSSQASK